MELYVLDVEQAGIRTHIDACRMKGSHWLRIPISAGNLSYALFKIYAQIVVFRKNEQHQ